jgi:hypothetical protein
MVRLVRTLLYPVPQTLVWPRDESALFGPRRPVYRVHVLSAKTTTTTTLSSTTTNARNNNNISKTNKRPVDCGNGRPDEIVRFSTITAKATTLQRGGVDPLFADMARNVGAGGSLRTRRGRRLRGQERIVRGRGRSAVAGPARNCHGANLFLVE